MKYIGITQRVNDIESYDERRDSLDQRWVNFLLSIDLLPILIPNNINYVKHLVNNHKIDGIILSGGESLCKYGGNVPERDEVEFFLIDWAINKNISLLGVCRGMQVIQDYFNNRLTKVQNHVGVRHKLSVVNNGRISELCKKYKDVNSYHNYGSFKVEPELKIIANSLDGVAMAIEHDQKHIYGVMWHMEREFPYCSLDYELFRQIFS